MLTEREKKFILNLKDRGYSKEEAVKALNYVRSQQLQVKNEWSEGSGSVSVDETSKPIGVLDKAGMAVGNFIEDAKGVMDSKVGKAVGAVGKGVVDGVLAVPNTVIGAGKGLATSLMNEAENQGVNVPDFLQNLAKPSGYIQKAASKGAETFSDAQIGVVKGVGNSALGIYDLFGGDVSPETKQRFQGSNIAQSLGKMAEQVAEFLVPSTKVAKLPALVDKGLAGFQLIEKYPKLAKVLPFLSGIIGETTMQTAVSGAQQGEITGSDVAVSAASSVVPPLFKTIGSKLGKTGEKIYEMAFKADKSVERKNIERYGESVGQMARKLGYTGDEQDIIEQAKRGAEVAKAKRAEIANNVDKVYRKEDFMAFAKNLAQSITKNLPQSQVKTLTQNAVTDMVMSYAPTGSKKFVTSKEMLGIIDDINAKQFSGKYALTDQQLSSFEQGLKSEIKKTLPKEISDLYTESAMNNTIRKVMSNNVVKKYILQTTIGASTGSIIGAVTAGGFDDPVKFTRNVILGALGVGFLTKIPRSTSFLTKTGKALQNAKNIDNPQAEKIIQSTIYMLRAINNEFGE